MKQRCGPLLFVLMLAASPCGFAQGNSGSNAAPDEQAGFQDFAARAQKYLELHRKIEKSLPKLKARSSPAVINGHQAALARQIQQAREGARPGDVFSPAAVEAFRRALAREFQGSRGENERATIRQGDPVANVQLQVNRTYPEKLPHTSVPPTLLQKLPKLPPELAYRIVGKDLALLDVKANLVVDVMHQALP